MKTPALKIALPLVLTLLIVPLLVSCDHSSYAVVPVNPVERFKDVLPFEAMVERVDIGKTTNNSVMIYLRTPVGERRVIVGPTTSAEMVGFAKTLRKGESYAFPSSFLEYQRKQGGK